MTLPRRALLVGAAGAGSAHASRETLQVQLMFSSGAQRTAMNTLLDGFRKLNPDLRVQSSEQEQTFYKEAMPGNLAGAKGPADVMLWFGGERLREFVRRGWVRPLPSLMPASQWLEAFGSAAVDAVSWRGQPFALPISTYPWGFYYRRSVFARLGLEPPATWADFHRTCTRLRAAGIDPIVVGGRSSWAVAGWFSLLNLRLNGLAFHRSLLEGRIAFSDARVTQVLRTWAALIEAGHVRPGFESLDWRTSLPYVSRGLAGLTLMGSFAALQFPPAVREDLGWFRFPLLNPAVPVAEEAPTDVLLVPANAAHPAAALRLLRYMADPGVQRRWNAAQGLLSPHRLAMDGEGDPLQRAARQTLDAARGQSQFFDRDTPAAFAEPAMRALLRLLSEPGTVEAIQTELDALRLQYLVQ